MQLTLLPYRVSWYNDTLKADRRR